MYVSIESFEFRATQGPSLKWGCELIFFMSDFKSFTEDLMPENNLHAKITSIKPSISSEYEN